MYPVLQPPSADRPHGAWRGGRRSTDACLWRRVLVSGCIVLFLLPGCEEQRRVPYVAPTLHNWARPYKGRPGLTLHVFRVGSLRVTEAFLLRRGGLNREREMPVLAYVLRHPQQGLVVINTGLNHRLTENGKAYFGVLLSLTTDAELSAGQDLPTQMRAAGLDPGAVRWVILTNLLFRHAGEVEAFPNARVVVSGAEHAVALEGGGGYIRREFDDVESWKFLDFTGAPPLGAMPAALDVFGDESCAVLDARGPTVGTLAVLIRLPTRPVLLAGDLAPLPESLRYAAAPASLRNREAWWDHIWRLKRFKDLDSELLVVPGHDPDTIHAAALPEIHEHAFTPALPERRTTPAALPGLLPGLP